MSHKPNMSLNTLFASVLVAGIVGMLAGFISRQLITPEYPHEESFPIEVTEVAGSGGAAGPTGPEPILALIAAADVAKGESLSKQCAACHDFTKGGPDRVGPNLWGAVNGPKAHKAGFAYSDDLKTAGGNWTYEDLNHFLWKPKSLIAGTKMNFIGLKKPEDRAAMIAWLRTQGDSPAALPSEAQIAAEVAEAEANAPKPEETTPEETADQHGTAGKDDAGTSAPGLKDGEPSTVSPANTGTEPLKEDPAHHIPSPDLNKNTKPAETPQPDTSKQPKQATP